MRRISKILLAALLCAGTVLPAFGCGDKKCKHNVGTWEVLTEATCETEGLQKGICGICYQEVEEKIPVDPEGHVYGEWSIGSLPTEEGEGAATRVCTVNSAHVLNITLPTLDSTDYKSTITTRPSALGDGERTYVLKHATGDLTFTQPVPATGVQTVRDAVELSVSAESKALIRRADGEMYWKHYEEGDKPQTSSPISKHSYEFGENYTHIVDGKDNCQRWYFTDETGKLYGLTDFSGGGKVRDDLTDESSEKYINGSRLYIQYYGGSNTLGYFYGVESLLEGLYRTARWSANGDFKEWTEQDGEGNNVYAFSYGDVQNSGEFSGYFTNTTVKAKIDSTFTISHLWVQSVIYVNSLKYALDDDGNPIFDEEGNHIYVDDAGYTWEYDEESQTASLRPGKEKGNRYVSTVEFTQTLKEKEGDVVPVNPHSTANMYVNDFDITYYDEVMQEGDKVAFASGKVTERIFGITNVTPTTALEDYAFDNFSFYLRTKDEKGNTVDLPINWDTMLTTGMSVDVDKTTWKFFLNAKQSGEQTVVVKTQKVEKVILCDIGAAVPTALYPAVYEYQDGKYSWEKSVETEETAIEKTVYTNQPLYFTADVPVGEKNYATSTYDLLNGSNEVIDITGSENYSATAINGTPVTQFISDKAGTYTVRIASTMNKSIRCTIKITVVKAPTFAELTAGVYEGGTYIPPEEGSYVPQSATATLSFSDVKTTDGGVTWTAIATVTANAAAGGGVETLLCTYKYDVEDAATLAQMQADGRTPTATLTSEHTDGREFGFKLVMNEGNDFVLSIVIALKDESGAELDKWEEIAVLKKKTNS